MATKVYPQAPQPCSSYMTSTRETFTVWMKSLVLHGHGCTVFNSNGEIVYRVDNYSKKCSKEAYLMDLRGNVLFSIQRKLFGHYWNVYASSVSKKTKEIPLFRVRKYRKFFGRGEMACEVVPGFDKRKGYQIAKMAGKSAFKVTDIDHGHLVAEVKKKQSSKGFGLGEDVLSLVVEPNMDHSLVMALVTVYELITHNI